VLENQGIFPLCQIEISSGVRRAASLRKEAAMTVDQKIREALRLEKLKLPRNPRVVDVRIEDYVDTSGEDALRVLVVLDEKVRVEKITGREVIDLKMAIRDWLREQGVELWPYISLAKQSELDEDEDDDDDVEE
jgi:cytidylate kinase